jgi:tetratricopeptide (TPR) repeat protein
MPAAAAGAGVLVYLALRPADRSPGLGVSAFDLAGLAQLVGTFGFYVGRVLVPVGLTAYMPAAPGGVAMIALAGVGVVAAAALLLPRDPTGIRRFGTLWFLLTLAPALLVAVAEMLVTKASERYLYLPSVGLALVVASALHDVLERAPTRVRGLVATRTGVAIATLTLAALAFASATRANLWRDEVALWSAVARAHPTLALPAMNLGLALTEAGRPDEAERAYRTALAGEGSETTKRDTAINLGHLALQRGRLDAAREYFEQANAMAPHASAYYGLGAVARSRARELLRAGDEAAAAEELTRARAALLQALAINPRHYQAHYVLGGVLYQGGDIPGAIAEYRQVVALAGDTPTGRDAAEALQQLTGAP